MHNDDKPVKPNNRFFHDYALTLILFGLMVVSIALQYYAGWIVFENEQIEHGAAPHIWGHDGYIWDFLQAVFENWQSEFLQLWTFVLLTTYFIHRNSPQSRDGDDETKERLDRIEKKLNRLTGQ